MQVWDEGGVISVLVFFTNWVSVSVIGVIVSGVVAHWLSTGCPLTGCSVFRVGCSACFCTRVWFGGLRLAVAHGVRSDESDNNEAYSVQ